MDQYQSLSHTRWECKYHVVFIHVKAARSFPIKLLKTPNWATARAAAEHGTSTCNEVFSERK